MKKIFLEKGNFNRPTVKKERRFDIRYGLPALVQQTKEQTYKFTGSQRECSFMLMVSCFSIFPVIEGFVFRAVSYNTSGSFYRTDTVK